MDRKSIFVLGILALCKTGGSSDSSTSDEQLKDFDDVNRQSRQILYPPRVGVPILRDERESCNKLTLRAIKEGVYFGDLRMRWRAASDCCELKGKSLLSHPERHLAAIQPFLPAGPNDFLNMFWVGGHDAFTEGYYYWVTQEWILKATPPFRIIYGNANQNCLEVGSEGLLIDIQCDHTLKFFCEDAPAGGKEPTAKELEFCETVEYVSEDDSLFKRERDFGLHNGVSRPLAKACCEHRGWKLASLSNLSAESLAKLDKLLHIRIFPHYGFWTSGGIEGVSQIYTWDSQADDIIPMDSPLWLHEEGPYPQQLFKRNRCVQVQRIYGRVIMMDMHCDYQGGILCQGEDSCVATDTVKILAKPGPNRFEFRSDATMAEKVETGFSLARHLSPSKSTRLNWSAVWERFSQPDGESPVAFDPADLATPAQDSACIAYFFAYKEYVATCNETVVAYVEPVVVTAENVSDLCATPDDCVVSPCTACDCWVLVATHNTLDVDPSLASRARDDIAPKSCFDFQPPLDYNDFTNALLTKEFVTALNPSPTTGVDWSEYYGNVTRGIQTERYVVRKGDVPAGSFVNIYKVKGTCGDYTTLLPVFKKVLFKTDDTMGNCGIAREENVPLAGC